MTSRRTQGVTAANLWPIGVASQERNATLEEDSVFPSLESEWPREEQVCEQSYEDGLAPAAIKFPT
eukprot:2506686-Lingulodinium_polyedra.AAC.1